MEQASLAAAMQSYMGTAGKAGNDNVNKQFQGMLITVIDVGLVAVLVNVVSELY